MQMHFYVEFRKAPVPLSTFPHFYEEGDCDPRLLEGLKSDEESDENVARCSANFFILSFAHGIGTCDPLFFELIRHLNFLKSLRDGGFNDDKLFSGRLVSRARALARAVFYPLMVSLNRPKEVRRREMPEM